MLVLSVTECPPALRGDLSRWLVEIDTGVYVGQVSQRVREELWARVTAHLKTGRAILVFTARNEQKMDFWVHQAAWEPIDFDGIKLMLRPNAARQLLKKSGHVSLQPGYSKAAKMQVAKRMAKARLQGNGFPEAFVVMDLETTGLDDRKHHIVELGAIRVNRGIEEAAFQHLIRIPEPLSPNITALGGITEAMLEESGQPIGEALPAFLDFLGNLPLLGHNLSFDLDFLFRACAANGLPLPPNRRMDTLSLARKLVPQAPQFKLTALMAHLQLDYPNPHRSLPDCRATLQLFHKLIEIQENAQ